MLALPEGLPLGRGAETGVGVFVDVEEGVIVGMQKGVFVGDEMGVGDEGRILDFFFVLALLEVLFLPLGWGAETGVGDKG